MSKRYRISGVMIRNQSVDFSKGKLQKLGVDFGLRKPNRDLAWYAVFQCHCGKAFISQIYCVSSGTTESCGCLGHERLRQRKTSHGLHGSPEYGVWTGIKQRCTNENDHIFKFYGGRGIRMCDKWINSFQAFFDDMGLRPSPKHEIDRIDNNGNYEPGNCRWVTNSENARNRRSNRLLTLNGVTKCLTEWAEDLNVNDSVIYHRIKNGWSIERALTVPKRI